MARNEWIVRQRVGRGFLYFLNDVQISNKEELAYYKSLGIPPAWKDVRIANNKKWRILATGYDKVGRMQYIYHPKFRARQEKAKFERILRFARALPKMRRITGEHLQHEKLDREKVLACIVRLLDQAYFRVGNEAYAKENQTYGLTTLRAKHTKVRGDTITFDFIGKHGKKHVKEITDKRLAKIVKKLDELPGYEIFKYYDDEANLRDVHSDDVNEYIKDIMGEEFSAKDFRTWGGTLLATSELAQAERAKSISGRNKTVAECIQNVASRLGNTPAIARSSYVDPRVINAFLKGNELSKVREAVKNLDNKMHYLSFDEHCVLHLLEKAEVKTATPA